MKKEKNNRSKYKDFKVIVTNPPTEEQKAAMIKRIEDYFSTIYSN